MHNWNIKTTDFHYTLYCNDCGLMRTIHVEHKHLGYYVYDLKVYHYWNWNQMPSCCEVKLFKLL